VIIHISVQRTGTHKWRAHLPKEEIPIASRIPLSHTYFIFAMVINLTSLLLLLSLGTISVLGHDDHDKDQMPLDYVRFPYQAMYPGDNTGRCSLYLCVRSKVLTGGLIPSDR